MPLMHPTHTLCWRPGGEVVERSLTVCETAARGRTPPPGKSTRAILGVSAPPRVCNPRDQWRDQWQSRRRRECGGCSGGGELAELLQDGVDLLESGEDLVSHLASGQHDLARDKDEEHDLGLHHPVDEAWEELGLIRRVVGVLVREALEPDRELDVARADHVLDLEVGEARRKIQLLDDPRELARRLPRLLLALCARDDHLA
mmetsp:Transcript_34228/g.110124  ORF Transcript_34228/g.110124 Transcript_34228/m.110124 type:complete len:202 (-) Transcript_34228:309-914(-)